MVVGGGALLGVLGDGVGHRAAGDAHLHRAELLEIAAHRGLGGDDAVRGEHLDQLRLARGRLLLQQARDAVLALGLAEGRHQGAPWPRTWVSTPRAACMRLAACCHTAERGPSITDADTSSPRWAG